MPDPHARWTDPEFDLAAHLRRVGAMHEDQIADALAIAGFPVREGSTVRHKLTRNGLWSLDRKAAAHG